MARLRAGFHDGTITDDPLTSGATTINSANFAALPEVSGGDVLVLVLDPLKANGAPEIVHVTAHTTSSSEVTVTRAAESTTAREHPAGTVWRHGPTTEDFIDNLNDLRDVDAAAPDDGDVLTWDDGESAWVAAGVIDGAWEHIDTQILDTTAASVSFQDIDTAYRFLRLSCLIAPTATLNVHLRLNNDPGNVYTHQRQTANGTTISAARSTNQPQIVTLIGVETTHADLMIDIQHTNTPTFQQKVNYRGSAGPASLIAHWGSGHSSISALVSRIDLITSTSTFAAGSRFVLEGIK